MQEDCSKYNILFCLVSTTDEYHISELAVACSSINSTLSLVTDNQRLASWARKRWNFTVHYLERTVFDPEDVEAVSRLIRFEKKSVSQSSIKSLMQLGQYDYVIGYVGPESLKYQFRKYIGDGNEKKFMFLDKTVLGKCYASHLPFSADTTWKSGRKQDSYVCQNDEFKSLLTIPENPKKHLRIIKSYLTAGISRCIEAIYSYVYRFLVKIMIDCILLAQRGKARPTVRRGVKKVLLCPQAHTEAAFCYSGILQPTPISALLDYFKNQREYDGSVAIMRLHPRSYDRCKMSDIIYVLRTRVYLSLRNKLENDFSWCDEVVTVNSNIGFEAIKFGRKVTALGKSYYPSVDENVKIHEVFEELLSDISYAGLPVDTWDRNAFTILLENAK